jgi:hypothetical protein
MFRTTFKIIVTVLAAAAVAVPVASAGSATPLGNAQVFSLGTALSEYQKTHPPVSARDAEIFSLGTALAEYAQKNPPVSARDAQIFSLGTALAEYEKKIQAATPQVGQAHDNGFAWGDAAIGGGIVAGFFLLTLGTIAAVSGKARRTMERLSHT